MDSGAIESLVGSYAISASGPQNPSKWEMNGGRLWPSGAVFKPVLKQFLLPLMLSRVASSALRPLPRYAMTKFCGCLALRLTPAHGLWNAANNCTLNTSVT